MSDPEPSTQASAASDEKTESVCVAAPQTDASSSDSSDRPDDALASDPEQLTRVGSGPAYSVFSAGTKKYIIGVVTLASFVSPMTANIYFPALSPIAADLGVSIGLINLTLTTYMVLQGIAPTLFGDFGDMAGRRPAFLIALTIYLVVNIALALQDDYVALLVLRMLQSCGSSGTLALGYAVVADLAVSAERGKYMGIVGIGINVGPAVSPVLGGVLAQYLGWRAIFWFCCILAACLLVPFALSVPETARNVVGNGSVPPPPLNRTLVDVMRTRRLRRRRRQQQEQSSDETTTATTGHDATPPPPPRKLCFPNPLRTLAVVVEKDLSLILAFAAVLYVVFIMVVATLSTIYADLYGLNELQLGLCYLPYGVGCCVASVAQGRVLDWNYRRTARRIGFTIDYRRGDDLAAFPIERARTQPMWPLVAVGVCAVIAYGWALDRAAPLAVPLVLLFVIGLTIVGAFSILNTLMVDLYPQAPATAVAAVNLVRCLLGAGVMAFIEAMLQRLGRGWNFTFWALLVVATSPAMLAVLRWGPRWREERRLRLARKQAERDEAQREKPRPRPHRGTGSTAPVGQGQR